MLLEIGQSFVEILRNLVDFKLSHALQELLPFRYWQRLDLAEDLLRCHFPQTLHPKSSLVNEPVKNPEVADPNTQWLL